MVDFRCPKCRQSVYTSEVTLDHTLVNVLDQLEFSCVNEGCQVWIAVILNFWLDHFESNPEQPILILKIRRRLLGGKWASIKCIASLKCSNVSGAECSIDFVKKRRIKRSVHVFGNQNAKIPKWDPWWRHLAVGVEKGYLFLFNFEFCNKKIFNSHLQNPIAKWIGTFWQLRFTMEEKIWPIEKSKQLEA